MADTGQGNLLQQRWSGSGTAACRCRNSLAGTTAMATRKLMEEISYRWFTATPLSGWLSCLHS